MSFKSINKTLKYSIRKLAVGATPVVIGTFLLTGGTTALASEGSGSNVSINYVADSELTDYEKSLVKQGIPEELKNGETYYLVYKNEAYLQKNKLPDTGSTSLPLKGIGFATALLTVVLVSKKNRNTILGIVLIGALGQSVVLPSSTFALENKLLAGYNHIISANTRFEDNLISIDGYKYIGYVTSQDLEVKLENKKNSNQGNVTKNNAFEKIDDEGIEQGIEKNTKEQTQKRLNNKKSNNTSNDNIIEINREKENNLIDKSEKERSEKLNNVKKDDSSNNIIKKENSLNDKTENEKTKVEKNLTDIVENDIDNIPLPIIAEEVLSETIRYDELEIEEVGNIDVANGNKINTTKTDYLVSTKDNNKLSMNSATELKFSESNKIEKTTIESKVQSTLEDKKNANIENNIKKSADIENINNNKSTIEDNKTNNPSDKINGTVNSLNKNSNSENSNIINKRAKTKSKVKVVERVIKVTETIPYKVVYVEDENMENGTTKVIKDGSIGKKVSIQKVVLNNDKELKREITSSIVKEKEVDKVIKVGTKGIKQSTSKSRIKNDVTESVQQTKLIPKKETVYTEILENKQRKYEKDYPKIQESTKNIKNNIGMLTIQKDKLSTINITNIFDDSLFEGERRLENVMIYYVQTNLKRKREFENQEEVIDTIISKQVPVITGVMRIGTRKHGYDTLKGDGKLVNLSSNLDEKEIKNIKLSNNSFILDKDVPGYLGSAINVNYEKDFKNTKLGLKFDVNKIQAQSIPTIYHYDKKTQLFKPLKTQIIGNMAYANINESGAYIVVDKYKQDRLRKSNNDLIPGDTGDSETVNKLNKKDEIKKSDNSTVSKGINNSDTVNKLNKKDEIKKSDNPLVSKGINNSDTVNKQDEIKKSDNSIVPKDIIDSKVKNISENGTGRSIVFVIENGGFMAVEDKNDLRKIIPKRIMQQLDSKKDKVSVVDFGNDIKINKALTSNFTEISKALDDMKIDLGMGDEITDGLSAGIERLIEDKDSGNKKNIFLLAYSSDYEQDYLRVIKKAKDNNITISVLSLDSVDEVLLKKVANETGGKFYKVKKIEDVPDNFNPFSENIKQNNMYINEDEISPYYTREILKGNVSLSPGKESPNFKKKIKDAREKISKEFNIEINDINAINKKIDDLKDDYIESLLSADNDNLINGKDINDKRDTKEGKIELSVDWDLDGDGIPDFDEKYLRKGDKDEFGKEYSPTEWNVGARDLLMFSDLAYFDFTPDSIGMTLSQISNKALRNKRYGDVHGKDKYFGSENFHYLGLGNGDSKDRAFFTKWRYLGTSELNYYDSIKSTVSYFKNGSNLVVAFRGTDEVKEIFADVTAIPLELSMAANRAEEQIEYILNEVTSDRNPYKYPAIENIYITGHSLGGYQAYYAFLKAHEIINKLKNTDNNMLRLVENINVANFNGPGLKIRFNDLKRLYDAKSESVKTFIIEGNNKIKGAINNLIVYESTGLLGHPKPQTYSMAYIKNKYSTNSSGIFNKIDSKWEEFKERRSLLYAHKLTSFYAHMQQGDRNTQDKFYLVEKDFIDKAFDFHIKNSPIPVTSYIIDEVKSKFNKYVKSKI